MISAYKYPLVVLILFLLQLVFIAQMVNAQEDCPPWAQERIAQIQVQAVNVGAEFMTTGNAELYVQRLQQLNAALAQLPAACLQQAGGGGDNRLQCQQQWDNFHRCERDFRYKLAAGQNPAYTCIRPNCVR